MAKTPQGGTANASRRDAQGTRLRLLDAASELFAERGYERATVRDIASRAGANQALLFRYFGSKKALFGEVMARGGQEQLRSTPPERLFEVALRGMLAGGGKAGTDRSLEVCLRSIGGSDEIAEALRGLGEEYAEVLATLSEGETGSLRADLALSWLLGIGLMRVVVAKEPLASADPDTVCALVAGALGNLLENLPKNGPADGESAGNPE
ncbi:TetR/AcrR family transcriptional regulator [Streptomyces lydicamycinicus]|uniref:Putative TetR family transcriptional regulator n=1 Tax=Streptomyces lydicamycinicus TaxID=1546107 RepID=A0A0P4R4U8_9ACTN|nr:TetR/AcrR family transcriptional regulator [Streptomyces lydicamycinicus]USA04505.1 TetR/AcrR family transcriptional regulator [Streptomyces lydicamycinicus]GAO07785.1 putative TetR family transcriptional regulator [Streptomyces lydicamycinicus]